MKLPGVERPIMVFIDCLDEYDFGQPHLYVLYGDFTGILLRKPVPHWVARLTCALKGRHRASRKHGVGERYYCRCCGTPLRKAMGQHPPQRGLFRREVIGPVECPILIRWTILNTRWGKLLVHRFLPNADDRAVHDHPAPFWTLVLKGGYDDMVPCLFCGGTGCRRAGATFASTLMPDADADPPYPSDLWRRCTACSAGLVLGDRMRRGTLRFRPARHRHRTQVLPTGAWTVVVMGPKQQSWGFFKDGRKWPWQKFEEAFGPGMRCPDDGYHYRREAIDVKPEMADFPPSIFPKCICVVLEGERHDTVDCPVHGVGTAHWKRTHSGLPGQPCTCDSRLASHSPDCPSYVS